MTLTSIEEDRLGADSPRPSSILRDAEKQAIHIAKFLRSNQVRLEDVGGKASVKDALAYADTIVALAVYGQKCDADQVIDVVARVEDFFDQLSAVVDCLLAKTV